MKKSIKLLGLGLLLTSGLISCSTDDFAERSDVDTVSGYANLTDRTISTFDTNADLSIKLFTSSDVTFSSVEVMLDSTTSTMATVSDDLATFNTSFLGALEVDSYGVTINSTLSNGKTPVDNFTISAVSPISISEDNLAAASMDTIANLALAYSTYTFSAAKDDVTLSLKKNMAGTYVASGAGKLDVDGGSVLLKDTNYEGLNLAAQDSLYYKYTITSGTRSADASGYIVVTPKS